MGRRVQRGQEGLLPEEVRGQLYIGWHCVVVEMSRWRCAGGSSASKHWINQEWHTESPPGSPVHQLLSPPAHQVWGKGFSVKVWWCWHFANKGSGSCEKEEREKGEHLQSDDVVKHL